MLSTFDRACIAVASACAVASNFVKVVSLDPLTTLPAQLLAMTFTAVGINDAAHTSTFSAALVSLVPDAVKADTQKVNVEPGLQISVVVTVVYALIAQAEA